jgi:hypothetical protein
MRNNYRRTVETALHLNTSGLKAPGGVAAPCTVTGGVTPWLALGCGYHLKATRNCSDDQTHYDEPCSSFDMATPYDPVLSWQLGTELNNLSQYSSSWHPSFTTAQAFAPWNYSQVACFYPSILDSRAQATNSGKSTSMVGVTAVHLQLQGIN